MTAAKRHNALIIYAKAQGRPYVTPEDVAAVLKERTLLVPRDKVSQVAFDLLRIMGKMDGFRIEDASLCAFVIAEQEEKLKPIGTR